MIPRWLGAGFKDGQSSRVHFSFNERLSFYVNRARHNPCPRLKSKGYIITRILSFGRFDENVTYVITVSYYAQEREGSRFNRQNDTRVA